MPKTSFPDPDTLSSSLGIRPSDVRRIVEQERHNGGMHTAESIRALLSKVTFAPSCVDMGWAWDVRVVADQYDPNLPDPRATDEQALGPYRPESFLIRTTFRRPDRETGEIQIGTGGWHHVPADSSDSGIVKRAFVAAKMILEHELMESFRYEDVRLFDPHHTIDDLTQAAKNARIREVYEGDNSASRVP